MRFFSFLIGLLLAISTAASGASADPGQVKLAWTPGPDTPQISVALQGTMWTQRGLNVQAISVPTGRDALEAVIGGAADFGAMAEFPVVVGAMQQKAFHVIAQISRYKGNRVIATSAMPLTSAKDLAGKKIGTTLGTNVNYQSDTVLAGAGVTATTVNAAPADLVPALARGDIDAAFVFPAFIPQAKKILGDKYRELKTPSYVTTFVIVASNDVLANHPDRVKAFLSGLLAANGIVAHDRPAAATAVSAEMNGIASPAALQALWPEYTFDVSLDQDVLSLLTKEGAWVHKQGLVKGDAPTEQLFRSYIAADPLRSVAPHNIALR